MSRAPAKGRSHIDPALVAGLLEGVRALPGVGEAAADAPLAASGLLGSSGSLLLASQYERRPGCWLVVAPDLAAAEALCDDLEAWDQAPVHYLPELEVLPFDRKSPTRDLTAHVQSALDQLQRGTEGFYVTTVYALRHKVMAREVLASHRIELRKGDELDVDALGERLAALGYRPAGVVESPGDFALRGGLVDVYSPSHELPLRIELFGDEVDSIRSFEPVDQRSSGQLDRATIIPALPLVMDDDAVLRAMARVEAMEEIGADDRTDLIERIEERLHFAGLEGLAPFFHEQETVLDYLPAGSTVAWFDPDELARRSELLDGEATRVRSERLRRGDPVPRADELLAPLAELEAAAARFRPLWLSSLVVAGQLPAPLGPPKGQRVLSFSTRAQERGNGDVAALAAELPRWHEDGVRPVMFCDNRAQADRLLELLDEQGVAGQQAPAMPTGLLHAGFVWREAGVAVLTDHQLFDRYRRTARRTRFRGSGRIADPRTLRPGDYCVHVDHGVGRFLGLRRITADGIESECLLIEYAGKDRLYVPTDNLLKVERYELPEDGQVDLHKLGTARWEKTKGKARKAIQAMAQELLTLYAQRASLSGHAYPDDDHLQREMEDSFVHEETPDQMRAIEDVKADMERPQPMDRLVCGDVGFGKTEVAMRAAFKAVRGGKQVAVLCPTTILAEQHRETFAQRMRDYPVTVEALSRFRTKAEQKEVLERTRAGKVDILVGTHRLLGRDVKFGDLGLLVVDEEQRFGVRHKERLKEMRKEVDVLTLSATPIPRTLYLSLMGARDLSIIATPPRERLPILTEVVGFSEEVVAEAILREMHRGGQVFFVHNRVETIEGMAGVVEKVVPQARVAHAHGQMSGEQLEEVFRDFVEGEYDVIVTTMIIESGLDMPNVNTILIDRADRFGLSQLYQLRGRVGRSRHQAYAYLMVPPGAALTKDARSRLAAIQEFTDLGSGYHIATRDLEIRGAGNILGESQHGHIVAIGFDLYCKLLEEEVRALKGEGAPRLQDVRVDLRASAYLPDEYIPEPELRMRWYRELSRVEDEHALDGIAAELRDRFGPFPPPVEQLVGITRLKLRAIEAGVEEVKLVRKGVRLLWGGERQPDAAILRGLLAGNKLPPLSFNAVDGLSLTIEVDRDQRIDAPLAVLGRLTRLAAAAA